MEKKTIKVLGMSCEHCVKAVKEAAASVNGVSDVLVDLKTGDVTFNFDPAVAELAAVKAAITEAGFEAGN
jgi:copper chaperone